MKTQIIKIGVLLAFVLILGACSSSAYHKVLMKGKVVKVNDGEVTLCIGSREGAKVNDEFRVVRSTFRTAVVEEGESDYELIDVGHVEIVSIVDEHYAIAKVIKGDIKVHDIAERAK
ncbi:hypothetical protein NBRC116494_15780 [Aurantivibrio plasticivorans]